MYIEIFIAIALKAACLLGVYMLIKNSTIKIDSEKDEFDFKLNLGSEGTFLVTSFLVITLMSTVYSPVNLVSEDNKTVELNLTEEVIKLFKDTK